MTTFFALPAESEAWLDEVVVTLDLARRDRPLPAEGVQAFLWPNGSTAPDGMAAGVMVQPGQVFDDTLTAGVTGMKFSAFSEQVAREGGRLNRQLTRSVRKWATIPLYEVSYKGDKSTKPFAWGSAEAVASGFVLRQFNGGAVTFVP